jgi:hypothetical protein
MGAHQKEIKAQKNNNREEIKTWLKSYKITFWKDGSHGKGRTGKIRVKSKNGLKEMKATKL